MPKSRAHPSRVMKKSGRSRLMKSLTEARRKALVKDIANVFAVNDPPAKVTSKKDLGNSVIEDASEKDILEERNEEPSLSLEREIDTSYKSLSDLLQGRRIVDLGHVLQEYEKVCRHDVHCTLGKMKFVKETRIGLLSKLHFFCDNCDKKFTINTDRNGNDVNTAAVWGSLAIGIGRRQCEELLGVLNLPFMGEKTFARVTTQTKKVWESHLEDEIQKAGAEEKSIAIQKGNVTADGRIFVSVIVDGGWSRRTYGHGYNAASGVDIIIGVETKKPLFLGIRNNTCSSCSYYRKRKIAPKQHECALNYVGPSTAMEQDIIVEGFTRSIEQHGLIHKYVIGDGDSSVYARIVERVPYGREVIKIECANPMTRCVNDKLHKLSRNTTYSLATRKLLRDKVGTVSRIEKLVKGVRIAVKNNANNAAKLCEHLSNASYHIFGPHNNCSDTFYTKQTQGELDLTKTLDTRFFMEVKKIIEPMISKADRLAYNETTNQAERYMALVAKCTGGKRINFSRRLSYTTRAYAAAISHVRGPSWQRLVYHFVFGFYIKF